MRRFSLCPRGDGCRRGINYNFSTGGGRSGSFQLWVYPSVAARAAEWAVDADGRASSLRGSLGLGATAYGVANLALMYPAQIDQTGRAVVDALLNLAAVR